MFAFCIATVSALFWPSLPPMWSIVLLGVTGIILIRSRPILAGSMLAIAWIAIYLQLLFIQVPITQLETTSISDDWVQGEIISLVSQKGDWMSADIRLINRDAAPFNATGLSLEHFASSVIPAYIRLGWRTPPQVKIGQIWSFKLRLKPITSVQNLGGYNQQRAFIAKHIIAKGDVKEAKLVTESDSLRSEIIERLIIRLSGIEYGDLILALLTADKRLIEQERWQALRETATGHLIAISGLHLSVVAAWGFLCSHWILLRVVHSQGRVVRLASLFIAAMLAIIYGYLADFTLPTQRALIMLLSFMILSWLKQFSSSWDRLLCALFIVLVWDPLSMLSAGFWLSFSALAFILLSLNKQQYRDDKLYQLTHNSREERPHVNVSPFISQKWDSIKQWLMTFWAVQWRLGLGLTVVQAVLFSGISIYGVLFNLLLVPWFSLVLIPLLLISFLCWGVSESIGWSWIDFQWLEILFWPMDYLFELAPRLPLSWITLSEQWIVATLFLSMGVVGFRWLTRPLERVAALILCLPFGFNLAVYAANKAIADNNLFTTTKENWQLHLLDVGQGLAVVVTQGERAILYDTGAAYGSNFSYADRVILPFLRAKGVMKLDYLFVSHSDNDHAGGVETILTHFPNTQLITDIELPHDSSNSTSSNLSYNKTSCNTQMIAWGGLQLQVLGALDVTQGQRINNHNSCMVRIVAKGVGANKALLSSSLSTLNVDPSIATRGEVLLIGDIDAKGELVLIDTKVEVTSRVLVAAHHGSKTSSSADFIDAVAPETVLFAAGFDNRYGFPHSSVLQRLKLRDIDYYVSGEAGQITVDFADNGVNVSQFRQQMSPFWYNQLFRFGESPEAE